MLSSMKKILLLLSCVCFYLNGYAAAIERTSKLIEDSSFGNINKKSYMFIEFPLPKEREVIVIYSLDLNNGWVKIGQQFISGKRAGQTECYNKYTYPDDNPPNSWCEIASENQYDQLKSYYETLKAECEAKNKAEHKDGMEVETP